MINMVSNFFNLFVSLTRLTRKLFVSTFHHHQFYHLIPYFRIIRGASTVID